MDVTIWSMIAAISIGGPLGARMEFNWLGTGVFCGGLQILFSHIMH